MKTLIKYSMHRENSKIFEIEGFGKWNSEKIIIENNFFNLKFIDYDNKITISFVDKKTNYSSKIKINKINESGKFITTINNNNLEIDFEVNNLKIDEKHIKIILTLEKEKNTILIARSE